jgi:hypothetical protein
MDKQKSGRVIKNSATSIVEKLMLNINFKMLFNELEDKNNAEIIANKLKML